MATIKSRLELDTSRFRSGMDAARGSVDDLRRVADRGLNIGRMIGGAAVVATMRSIAREMDEIVTKARQLGITGEAMQRLSHVANQSGTNVETLSRALTRVSAELNSATDAGARTTSALAALGVDRTAFQVADAESRLHMLADAFSGMEDRGAASAAVVDLFGQRAAEMIRLLDEGGDALRRTGGEINVVSEADLARIKAVNDQLGRYMQNMRNLGATAMGTVARGVEGITDLASERMHAGMVGLERLRDGDPLGEVWRDGRRELENFFIEFAGRDERERERWRRQVREAEEAAERRIKAEEEARAAEVASAEKQRTEQERARDAAREAEQVARDRARYEEQISRNVEELTKALQAIRIEREEAAMTEDEILRKRQAELDLLQRNLERMRDWAAANELTNEEVVEVLAAQIREQELLLELEEARARAAEHRRREEADALREREREVESEARMERRRLEGAGAGGFDRLRQIGLGAAGVNYGAAPPSRELRVLEQIERRVEEVREEVRDSGGVPVARFRGI